MQQESLKIGLKKPLDTVTYAKNSVSDRRFQLWLLIQNDVQSISSSSFKRNSSFDASHDAKKQKLGEQMDIDECIDGDDSDSEVETAEDQEFDDISKKSLQMVK